MKLNVKGLSHVPSFKNSKMILWNQRRIMTKPEIQRWMEAVTDSFVLQSRSAFRTSGTGTMTGPLPLSLIASLLPLDDSRKWIPELSVSTRLVSKGSEGAEILIEPL